MSKFNADKTTGLPPNTASRLQLPDIRLSGTRLDQDDRQSVRKTVGKGKPFGRVGDVGPGVK